MEKLSLQTRTLYAELLDLLVAAEAGRSIGNLPGCFTFKKVKGEDYCYFQYSMPGALRQAYIGRRTPVIERLVERHKKDRERLAPEARHFERLCAQLRAGGAMATETAAARVLRAFAEAGVFKLGGLLVGTHAFVALGNMLGVRWGSSVKTQDVDIAGERRLDMVLPDIRADLPKALELLEMGFLPVPALDPRSPSAAFKVRGGSLRVDLLTPQTRMGGAPVFIPRFNAAAQPLRFLDYLLEERQQGAVLNGSGVLVCVPSPARFALHKLIVSVEREPAFHAKREKDLLQAALLIRVLAEERPGDLAPAWRALKKRGPGWEKRARQGLAALKSAHPEAWEAAAGRLG